MLTSPMTDAAGAAALSAMPPDLDSTDAAALALQLYGVAGIATQLTSERDQNFLVRSDAGETWLLKISNPSEPDDVVAFQTASLDHVARLSPNTPVPRVLRTLAGKADAALTLRDGRQCRVRLLTYLEGVPVRGTERTAAQRRALGAALADLDLALASFTHPAGAHDLLWNVAGADRLADRIDAVATGSRAALLRQFMDRFCRDVMPRLGALRAQMIHNDYHLFNVLVAAEDETRVTGIIDFGDMIHAPLVAEVATGAAYQLRGADDPLGAAATFVAGYHEVLPLEPAEQEIVADLMATRHLITVLISEWRVLRYPENKDYIMRHNGESWDALHLMADMPRAALRDRLLSGIGTGDLR